MKSTKGNGTTTIKNGEAKTVFFSSILTSVISITFAACLIENGNPTYKLLGVVAIGVATNMIYTAFKWVISKNNQSSWLFQASPVLGEEFSQI